MNDATETRPAWSFSLPLLLHTAPGQLSPESKINLLQGKNSLLPKAYFFSQIVRYNQSEKNNATYTF